MLRAAAVSLACLVLIVVACLPPYALWIEPGSTSANLIFGLATRRGGSKVEPLDAFRVRTCERVGSDLSKQPSEARWEVVGWGEPPDPRRIRQVRYGVTPRGMRESLSAQPLTPGCYGASADAVGLAWVTFWVSEDGSVRELTKVEIDSIRDLDERRTHAMLSDADTAIARCRAAYASAVTSPESLSVDQAVFNDTTKFGKRDCAFFRRFYRSSFPSERSGTYVWGPEVNDFKPCGVDSVYWVVAIPPLMARFRAAHESLATRAYERIYVTVRGERSAEPTDGFAAQTDGYFAITAILEIRRLRKGECS